MEVKKEILFVMFKYNKFKCWILNEKVNILIIIVYRCGFLIDFCWGFYVRYMGKIKVLKIYKNFFIYWEGKVDMEIL